MGEASILAKTCKIKMNVCESLIFIGGSAVGPIGLKFGLEDCDPGKVIWAVKQPSVS